MSGNPALQPLAGAGSLFASFLNGGCNAIMKFSSILKKAVMALTGLALGLFLVTHLLGNLQLPMGAEKFNAYAQTLEEHPEIIIPDEIGLVAVFLIHVFMALKLTAENKEARPIANDQRETAGQSSFASRHMWLTGFVILVFVVVHVWQFKYGERPITAAQSNGSLWDLVVVSFKTPWIATFYVLCMLIMGFHLSHGVGSLFQSLGLNNSSGRPRLKGLGPVIGWGLAIGFAMLPLWVCIAQPQASPSKAAKPAIWTPVPGTQKLTPVPAAPADATKK